MTLLKIKEVKEYFDSINEESSLKNPVFLKTLYKNGLQNHKRNAILQNGLGGDVECESPTELYGRLY